LNKERSLGAWQKKVDPWDACIPSGITPYPSPVLPSSLTILGNPPLGPDHGSQGPHILPVSSTDRRKTQAGKKEWAREIAWNRRQKRSFKHNNTPGWQKYKKWY
jgi:hypothetical protein